VYWSAGFAEKYRDDISWWTSRVWERNTMVSSIFLYLCYVKLVERIIEKYLSEKSLLIVCESSALLLTLKQHLLKKGYNPIIAPGWKRYLVREKSYLFLKVVFCFCRGMKKLLVKRLCARATKKYQKNRIQNIPARQRIIIHTCVDDQCLGKNHVFYDRYFPSLSEWLEKKGYEVITIPWLYNVTMPLKDAYRWFRTNSKLFLIPEDYYQISDYLWAIVQFFRRNNKPAGKQFIDGIDVTHVIRSEKIRQLLEPDTINFILYYALFKRLKKKGFEFNFFIDTFENIIPEKPQILSIKKYFPQSTTIGYQHALILALLLTYQTTSYENQAMPYPDFIVSCSNWTRTILIENGFDACRIIAGPSLRYQYLFHSKEKFPLTSENRNILIICPLAIDAAVELLLKSIEAIKNLVNLYDNVYVKIHPMMIPSQLLKVAKIEKLPKKWQFVSGRMEQWLGKSSCAVCMDSSAILEAIIAGLPSVIVGRETDLTMNPLAWLKDPEFQPVFDMEQLHEKIVKCMEITDEKRKYLKTKGEEMLNRLSKADEENLMAYTTTKQ
ncbi:MAG: hypothetical protein ACP5QD_01510, partial [Candidatus Ratteibacteria bacterium]